MNILAKPEYTDPIVAKYDHHNMVNMHKKVACVWVKGPGNYNIEHVKKLHSMVTRNTTGEIDFICFTDHKEAFADLMNEGIKPQIVEPNMSGWWQKVRLFNDIYWQKNDRIMYLDLDIVIVDNIDHLFHIDHHTAAIANFGVNFRHSKYNSSVVVWDGKGPARKVWNEFHKLGTQHGSLDENHPARKELHGDQCWFWRVMLDDVRVFEPRHVVSYKYETRRTGLEGSKVIVFHGQPKPWQVRDNWIKQHYK